MPKAKKTMNQSEDQIPLSASRAFKTARLKARNAGHVVLAVENGKLIRFSPEGEQEVRRIDRVDAKSVPFERDVKTPITWSDKPD